MCTKTVRNRGEGVTKGNDCPTPTRGPSPPTWFDLLLDSSSCAVSFSRVRVSRSIPFISLWEALSLPYNDVLFTNLYMDKSFDLRRRSVIMVFFLSLDDFVQNLGRLWLW